MFMFVFLHRKISKDRSFAKGRLEVISHKCEYIFSNFIYRNILAAPRIHSGSSN